MPRMRSALPGRCSPDCCTTKPSSAAFEMSTADSRHGKYPLGLKLCLLCKQKIVAKIAVPRWSVMLRPSLLAMLDDKCTSLFLRLEYRSIVAQARSRRVRSVRLMARRALLILIETRTAPLKPNGMHHIRLHCHDEAASTQSVMMQNLSLASWIGSWRIVHS